MQETPHLAPDPARRFGGIGRLYGESAIGRLAAASVCVIGIGGVGSWVAEALARSGVGRLTLIDLDHVAESNINRQAHALEDTLGQAKVLAMAARLRAINPLLRVEPVDAFVDADNVASLVGREFDAVVDAIDSVPAKAALITHALAIGVGVVTVGAAGGQVDPTRIVVGDLSRTEQDPLLARLRKRLRGQHGFPRDPRRRFGVDAVYSTEPLRYPEAACEGGQAAAGLNCAGFGSSMMVTASFGLAAAARVVDRLATGSSPGGVSAA